MSRISSTIVFTTILNHPWTIDWSFWVSCWCLALSHWTVYTNYALDYRSTTSKWCPQMIEHQCLFFQPMYLLEEPLKQGHKRQILKYDDKNVPTSLDGTNHCSIENNQWVTFLVVRPWNVSGYVCFAGHWEVMCSTSSHTMFRVAWFVASAQVFDIINSPWTEWIVLFNVLIHPVYIGPMLWDPIGCGLSCNRQRP